MWGCIEMEGQLAVVQTLGPAPTCQGGAALAMCIPLLAVGRGPSASAAVAEVSPTAACSSISDPYSASEALLSECGIGSYPRARTERLSDGGTSYIYDVDGDTTVYKVPPAGFTAATASPAELSRYGIPPEPSSQAGRQRWLAMVSNMSFVTPPAVLHDSLSTAAPPIGDIWSGYVATSSTDAYTAAGAQYIEPSPLRTSCPDNAALFWTGLGGVDNPVLAQDGTGINDQAHGLGQDQAWYEVLPDEPTLMPIYGLYATEGGYFFAETSYSTLTGYYEFFMYNYSTGKSKDIEVQGSGFDGQTADFIAERPSVGPDAINLTNFGSVSFTFAAVDSSYLNTLPNYGVPMVSQTTGNLLAASGATGGPYSGFNVHYYGCS